MMRAPLVILAVILGAAAESPKYEVIVHRDNPARALSRGEVAKLLLGKIGTWPSGLAVQPVDLPEDDELRERFSREVLGRSVGAVRAWWQQQLFSGRGVPPPELSEAEVVAYVAANRGAIGYVSAGIRAPGVHAVTLTE
jgi:ABC-type phosphate transport system substrate-binding protein